MGVDIQTQLRGIVLAIVAHFLDQRTFRRQGQQLVAGSAQRLVPLSTVVLQVGGETRRNTQLWHRGRYHDVDYRVLDLTQLGPGSCRHGVGPELSAAAHAPGLPASKRHSSWI